ncbi:hypothetical protein LCGC14_2031160 [marine sediment metagenome]|uniref:Uncharacterized protein n=1 Tax=marine sediment metagenome TaxID=412755 RepID=A0A0F9EUW1_9ZZZZ
MVRYGYPDLKVEFDDAAAALIDMSQYIMDTPPSFDREQIIEEITAAGDSDEAHAKVGLTKVAPITMGGAFDDTATTGPDVIFNSIGDTRTLKITWGSTKTSEVECIITNYVRTPARGELTKFTVTLQPTGAVTEV